jgi:hypothetical protein
MPSHYIHEPTGHQRSRGAEVARWIRLVTVTLPLLALWFVAAAAHDAVLAIVALPRRLMGLASRARPTGVPDQAPVATGTRTVPGPALSRHSHR